MHVQTQAQANVVSVIHVQKDSISQDFYVLFCKVYDVIISNFLLAN